MPPDASIQGLEHRIPVLLVDIVRDDRGQGQTGLCHSRGGLAGKLLQIVDENRHVPVAQRVFGHDGVERTAIGVDPLSDGPAQGTVRICGTKRGG